MQQNETTDATRKRILDAFWHLYQKQSLDTITANQIATTSGVHRSSFYRYYKDIKQVYTEFESIVFLRIQNQFEHIPTPSKLTLSQFMNELNPILEENADEIYCLMKQENGTFQDSFSNLLTEYLTIYIKKDIRKFDESFIISYIISNILYFFHFWYENQSLFHLSDINRMGEFVLLKGISNYL